MRKLGTLQLAIHTMTTTPNTRKEPFTATQSLRKLFPLVLFRVGIKRYQPLTCQQFSPSMGLSIHSTLGSPQLMIYQLYIFRSCWIQSCGPIYRLFDQIFQYSFSWCYLDSARDPHYLSWVFSLHFFLAHRDLIDVCVPHV